MSKHPIWEKDGYTIRLACAADADDILMAILEDEWKRMKERLCKKYS